MSTLFGEEKRQRVEGQKKREVKQEIRETENDKLRKRNKEEFIDDLVGQQSIDIATISPEDRSGVKDERGGSVYLEVRIPYDGSSRSFKYNPSSIEWPVLSGIGSETFEVRILKDYLSFELKVSDKEESEVREEIQEKIEFIEDGLDTLSSDFEEFESELHEEASELYDSQIESADQAEDIIDNLDMPTEEKE